MKNISIITPTFNRVEALKRNIESVSKQNFKNKEHIIIDNLSNDGTEELIRNYKASVSYSVIYIREKDFGIYNAMNKGIKNASGEWIHILNSDDYYYSNNSLEIFFSEDTTKFDIIAHSIMVKKVRCGNDMLYKCDPEYMSDLNVYRLPHAGVFIKKKFHELNGYYSEKYKILSDSMFLIRNLSKANFKINKTPLVVMTDSGVSSKFSLTRTYEFLVYNFIYFRGPLKFKLKFTLLNLKGDLRLLLKQIKDLFVKNN